MTESRNTIRTYALAAVTLTSIALIGFTAWLIWLIGVSDWCGRAIGAGKSADARPEFAVTGCYNLLDKQVSGLTILAFIALGTLALCLAVLVVIVIAGGRLSFKAGKDGVDVDMSHDAGEAAQVVADAAQNQADAVKATTGAS